MNKINYDLEMQKIVDGLNGEKPTLLLHACCAPCLSSVIERLVKDFAVTVFFFNPNITESEEYNLRLNEVTRFLADNYAGQVNLICGRYSSREFFDAVVGLEKEEEGGGRCAVCFTQRLTETAKVAKDGGFRYFCTTLTVSPHKNADVINAVGEKAGGEYGVKFLPSDFKKRDGYARSIRLSEENGLYRQNYCGCVYSKYSHIKVEEDENNRG